MSSEAPKLDAPVHSVKGIGSKRAEVLRTVGIETVEDLLYYLPRRYLDRSHVLPIAKLPLDEEVTVIGEVEAAGFRKGGKPRFVMTLGDRTGLLECIWFQGLQYMRRRFSQGDTLAVSGKVSFFRVKQMVHPEVEVLSAAGEESLLHTGRVIPIYPGTEELRVGRLDSRGLRRLIRGALDDFAPQIEETLPEEVIDQNGLLSLKDAIVAAHFPDSWEEIEHARTRLAFDELFYFELLLALRKRRQTERADGIPFERVGTLISRLLERLPFELTDAQKRVLREIRADMKRPYPMNRLLQGDVGSGKTLVAVIAMLIAIENGYQAALMAPTEILAEQHFLTLRRFLEDLGVNVRLLIGGMPASERTAAYAELADGAAQIAVGTHALIQEDVAFARLGLAIVDEQHRFGVMQRAALRSKGPKPDVLVMTATPIPRTLALTLYGDLDVSVLDEMPPGRQPIRTVTRSIESRPQILSFIRDQVAEGRQAYIVYPLVEESEKIDLAAAVHSYEELRDGAFSDLRIGLLHGRMRSEEKEHTMAAFSRGEIDVLVGTTVIEVGVDVPNASVMLIEHAERFGLFQLHQMRGRVGRGPHASYCILVRPDEATDDAQTRLNAMKRTSDGFEIAETDLELRGPGQLMGTRQSGMPELRIAHLLRDAELLVDARRDAFATIEKDPLLERPEHRMMRNRLLGGRWRPAGLGLLDIG